MKIIQLTDLHLTSEGEFAENEIDTWKAFEHCLEESKYIQPDLIVISGDVCYLKGDEEVYRKVKVMLEDTGIPYHVLPGNHDSEALYNVFNLELESGKSFYISEGVLFLDTADAYIGKKQLEWLAFQIEDTSDEDHIIFVHHPPIAAGVPHMDNNYPLQDTEDLFELFKSYEHDRFCVFCGHYHVDKQLIQDNLRVFITPSNYMWIDPSSETFAMKPGQPNFRVIKWEEGKLDTYVRYF